MLEIEYIDGIEPWCKKIIEKNSKMRKEALGKLGGHLRKEIRKGIKSKAPGGRPYKKTMPAKRRRALDQAFGGEGKNRYPILGRLHKAVGFQVDDYAENLKVGMLSQTATKLMQVHEFGKKRRVTPFIRRKFFQAGVGLSEKQKFLNIPKRPTFEPLKRILEPEIPGYVQKSISNFLEYGIKSPPPKKRTKKYQVFQ